MCMCQLSNIIIQILVQRFIEINMSLSLYLYGKVLCMPGMFITSEKLVFLILKAFMTGFFVLFFFLVSFLTQPLRQRISIIVKPPPAFHPFINGSRSTGICDDLTCNSFFHARWCYLVIIYQWYGFV